MEKQKTKMQMARENTFAIQAVEDSEGRKTYILKDCYHCLRKFIARKRAALACSKSCSTSISHKLTRGHDLSGQFKVKEIGDEIDFGKYGMRENQY